MSYNSPFFNLYENNLFIFHDVLATKAYVYVNYSMSVRTRGQGGMPLQFILSLYRKVVFSIHIIIIYVT